jgi:hypothetical protein
MCQYFGKSVKRLNFEFGSITDEHIEKAILPGQLEELNLNGCREISEKTLV